MQRQSQIRIAGLTRATTVAIVVGAALAFPVAGQAAKRTTSTAVQRGLAGLVAAKGGPPGAIATFYSGGHTTVLRAGRADVTRSGAPRANEHMRIASVSKAFNGAVALALVKQGRLRLDEPIGRLLGGLPSAWRRLTVRELLNHTSGLPNYTVSPAFFKALRTPHAYVAPSEIIDWVRAEPLNFAPGSRFEYSNTDNVVVALIAEAVTHQPYHQLLSKLVFAPAKLRQTSFPTRALAMPSPFMPGYQVEAGAGPIDITTLLSPSQAWAAGALVSTPADLGRFIRDYLNRTFFGVAQQRQQLRFVPGASDPPGPGANAAGLAIFRYRTRCGTVYGHTGNYPGYTQWVAATADGSRSVTTSLNFSVPNGALLGRLRALQATAVCLLLGR